MTLTREEIEKKWDRSPSWARDEWISEVIFNQPVRNVPWIGKYVKNEKTGYEYILPCYTTDISATWEVEERIAVLEKEGYYVKALCDVLGGSRLFAMDDWRMIHAKPDERCKAALLAVLNL